MLFSILPTKVYNFPFSSFLLFSSLSLSLFNSNYLSLSFHLFYPKINPECYGPKLTVNIMFLFNMIILQYNLVLVN